MALSLVVVAGATGGTEGSNEVTLITKPTSQAKNTDGTVDFEVWLDPKGTKTIGAFQFSVEGVGCTLTGDVVALNTAELKYNPEADPKTGYFDRFGGNFSSDKYNFVAAGTADKDYKVKGVTYPAHIWTAEKPTHIVTLKVTPTDDYCYLKINTTDAEKRFTVGAKDDNGKVSEVYTPTIKQEGFGTPAVTTVTITGTITSYNPNNTATVQLMDGENVVKTVTDVSGEFTLESVPAGTYDLVVTKAAHLTYTIKNITVGSDDIDLKTITLLCGDIDGDGKINVSDLNIVWNAANYNKAVSAASNELTDVNGDGKVNVSDLNLIWNAANYNKSAAANCTVSY